MSSMGMEEGLNHHSWKHCLKMPRGTVQGGDHSCGICRK